MISLPLMKALMMSQAKVCKKSEVNRSETIFLNLYQFLSTLEPDASRELDASHSGKRLKTNQPKNFSYPTKKIGKEERRFLPSWCDKWT